MLHRARNALVRTAELAIRHRFDDKLKKVTGPEIKVDNVLDFSSPSINFTFIMKSVPVGQVTATDNAIVVGCGEGSGSLRCKPHMGQNMGCEYSQVCECLEFAAIDDARMKESDRRLLAQGIYMGLPKRFPYFASNELAECLVPFYLESRNVIYECNLRCKCGPGCKTRVVQKGRKIPFVIFKTQDRGWGLRSPVAIRKGQFIDTYRGEIITNGEADRREADAGNAAGKQSYFYSLDKHVGDDLGGGSILTEEDCYVVDGEYMGGPTRFMNHSCDPNCRQYTVSYNKYDVKIYELAFFACKNIPAGTELTFNYKDADEDVDEENLTDEDDGAEQESMKCRCGSENCKGRLWV